MMRVCRGGEANPNVLINISDGPKILVIWFGSTNPKHTLIYDTAKTKTIKSHLCL